MTDVHVRDDMPTTSHCDQPTSHATHANVELPEQHEDSSILDSCESDPVIKVLAIYNNPTL